MINITEIQYLSSAIGQGKKWMAGEKKKSQTKDIMEREGRQKLSEK